MNKCIFCGLVARDPTIGLRTKVGTPMSIFTVRLVRRDNQGNWTNDYVDIFAYTTRAAWVERKLKKGMKIIAICNLATARCVLQPEVGKTKPTIFYKPYFMLEEFFCTDTREVDDYAQDRDDAVFSGILGETMVDAAKYHQQRQKSDYDYSKRAHLYHNKASKIEYPQNDESYYKNMLDDIAKNADMSDIEMQEEEKQ